MSNRVRALLLPWHRRSGVAVAVFVLMLAVSGLLLNHTEDFQLDQRYIESPWILSLYGIEEPEPNIIGYAVNNLWVVQWNQYLFLNELPIKSCEKLVGAQNLGEQILIACADEIFLINQQGVLVEQVGASLGLPVPVESLLLGDSSITLVSGGSAYHFDWNVLRFEKKSINQAKLIEAKDIPFVLLEKIKHKVPPAHSIHWERFLLDVHSGRIFGKAGVWLFDVAAILLVFLALSGVYVWAIKLKR